MEKTLFEQINWDEINPKNTSLSFQGQKGYSIVIWEKEVGEANNNILNN